MGFIVGPQIPRFCHIKLFVASRGDSPQGLLLTSTIFTRQILFYGSAEIYRLPLSKKRPARNALWGMIKGFITRSTDPF